MNGLGEIQEFIKKFICEKQQKQQQIAEIEEKRTQLAQQRNEKKKSNSDYAEINELGRQISELGNQSQELQNKLEFKLHEVKSQINLVIDNLVAEGIRKIRIANGEIQDLETKIETLKERQAKYELQKQEFYLRFGRMPELSERALKENKLQGKDAEKSSLEIEQLKGYIAQIEGDIIALASTKREVKNGNWNSIIENEAVATEFYVEEITIEEIEPIEEITIEEFEPIEEINIQEFNENYDNIVDMNEEVSKVPLDEIEELARSIIEEIVAEQTKEQVLTENVIKFETEDDIITFEEKKEKVIIPLFGQKATISNIIIKFEDGNLVYKAQMSDEEEIKIYPAQLGEENVLLRDKQNREECKEILINYAVNEYKVFDKKIVNKIDPLVCELLIECAERYGYNAQELVYNYAMSFSEGDSESVPGIIYNLSYIEQSNLSRKEKTIINKICRSARKNNNIDIIESFSGFKKIKYVLKRLFAINNVKVLPEAKY